MQRRVLYFVTPSVGRDITPASLPALVEKAVRGGVDVVQWRQKPSTADLAADAKLSAAWGDASRPFLQDELRKIRAITKQAQVPLIVNDSLDLALEIGADGVHVGQSDETLQHIHQRLDHMGKSSRDFIIGVTVRDADQAQAACKMGASYLGAGPVFLSSTKPTANDGVQIGIIGLASCSHAAAEFKVPVFAIGGVDGVGEKLQQCMVEGMASGVAVVAAIGKASDPQAAATQLRSAISQHRRVSW